jgi:hypothetical protein
MPHRVLVEYVPLISDLFNIFDMITVRRPRFEVGFMDTVKVYTAWGLDVMKASKMSGCRSGESW